MHFDFLTSMVFKPHISSFIHKYSDLTIGNEIITIMALNNTMCNEKEKIHCGEQMSQEPPSIKRNLFCVYRVGGNAMKISLSHLVRMNCVTI